MLNKNTQFSISVTMGHKSLMKFRAGFRLAPSQCETVMSLQSKPVSQWLGANLESALKLDMDKKLRRDPWISTHQIPGSYVCYTAHCLRCHPGMPRRHNEAPNIPETGSECHRDHIRANMPTRHPILAWCRSLEKNRQSEF